jgi:orotate phosphoribosyltransferase
MTLLHQLIDSGLLQFGAFVQNGVTEPVRFQLEMLASYPAMLAEATETLSALLPPVDRLLSTAEAIPLGTALALKSGIPLVYSRGGEDEPAFDLVGAYDIGHPAIFVANVAGYGAHERLLSTARRVGLNVHSIACLIDLGVSSELPRVSLFHIQDVLAAMLERGALPVGQVRAVEMWLEGKTQGEG